jgi:hypothetical protein
MFVLESLSLISAKPPVTHLFNHIQIMSDLSSITAGSLFRVDGIVAAITGGGTGISVFSISFPDRTRPSCFY